MRSPKSDLDLLPYLPARSLEPTPDVAGTSSMRRVALAAVIFERRARQKRWCEVPLGVDVEDVTEIAGQMHRQADHLSVLDERDGRLGDPDRLGQLRLRDPPGAPDTPDDLAEPEGQALRRREVELVDGGHADGCTRRRLRDGKATVNRGW
jgi:hypothetical protein